YIAPAAGDTEIIGAKPLDETNPLHKSGIKKISAKGGEVTVSYAIKDIEAYGVVAAKYTEPAGVEDNVSDKVQTKCIVKGSQVDVNADAKVRIISINGSICGETMISGNGTVSVANLSKGMYLIHVMYTDGSAEVVKVIR
ncbi:MAG: T9SS type A sorting domain-containing protein, partial [Muribaculaceae bacterium]